MFTIVFCFFKTHILVLGSMDSDFLFYYSFKLLRGYGCRGSSAGVWVGDGEAADATFPDEVKLLLVSIRTFFYPIGVMFYLGEDTELIIDESEFCLLFLLRSDGDIDFPANF